ncbi:hypothetical protein NA56DRAFT_710464 [Hyaloscypha hepaticicola]|uniref:Uncharacterized protein n=1 Tax=Hyaloscypha hepaticicola TaxID=2082293 RepID=A0A2J6PL78_9HELO|nr:hypothetical protein NA56DRAFT_710464 [Hyaloscypha hepaticicola]
MGLRCYSKRRGTSKTNCVEKLLKLRFAKTKRTRKMDPPGRGLKTRRSLNYACSITPSGKHLEHKFRPIPRLLGADGGWVYLAIVLECRFGSKSHKTSSLGQWLPSTRHFLWYKIIIFFFIVIQAL